jgi:hypothetical protein
MSHEESDEVPMLIPDTPLIEADRFKTAVEKFQARFGSEDVPDEVCAKSPQSSDFN